MPPTDTPPDLRPLLCRLQALLYLASQGPLPEHHVAEVTKCLDQLAAGPVSDPAFRGRAALFCLDVRKAVRGMAQRATPVGNILENLHVLQRMLD